MKISYDKPASSDLPLLYPGQDIRIVNKETKRWEPGQGVNKDTKRWEPGGEQGHQEMGARW